MEQARRHIIFHKKSPTLAYPHLHLHLLIPHCGLYSWLFYSNKCGMAKDRPCRVTDQQDHQLQVVHLHTHLQQQTPTLVRLNPGTLSGYWYMKKKNGTWDVPRVRGCGTSGRTDKVALVPVSELESGPLCMFPRITLGNWWDSSGPPFPLLSATIAMSYQL